MDGEIGEEETTYSTTLDDEGRVAAFLLSVYDGANHDDSKRVNGVAAGVKYGVSGSENRSSLNVVDAATVFVTSLQIRRVVNIIDY